MDDFALRKGQNYGTILVDLEQNQPIALLPDRSVETLEAWLKEHPGVEILSRDRSKTYRSGMDRGALDAIQMADRFHLLKNLEKTLETFFKGQAQVLQKVERAASSHFDIRFSAIGITIRITIRSSISQGTEPGSTVGEIRTDPCPPAAGLPD